MTSRQYRFALSVVLALLIVLPSCKKNVVGAPGPYQISLSYNATTGQCTQNNSSGVLDVDDNWTVSYIGSSVTTPFDVEFSSCPFATGKCPVSSPNGGSQNVGTPVPASVNNTYYYSSITINGQTCNNGPGTYGVHIKPGTMAPK
jgi:hypothetical protein